MGGKIHGEGPLKPLQNTHTLTTPPHPPDIRLPTFPDRDPPTHECDGSPFTRRLAQHDISLQPRELLLRRIHT